MGWEEARGVAGRACSSIRPRPEVIYFSNGFRCLRERSACSTVPHSTESTMSRGHSLRMIWMTFFQSITPSPQAQPTRRAGDLASFGAGLLDRDVLGVEVHEPLHDPLQPLIGIVSAQEGVAGVKVDPNARALNQTLDTVQAVGVFAVLLVV